MARRFLSPQAPMTRRFAAGVSASLLAFTTVACQANPGDAPTVDDDTTETAESTRPTAPPSAEQLRVNVGVDSFSGNLNPHLVGNVNPVISTIADLTLPSAFVRAGDSWEMNSTLLSEVTPDNPDLPTSVVYKLNSAAQWSDGTPLSISDFQYLTDRIVKEPGTSEAASYEQIKSITAERGGAIKVTFHKPFAGWKELFRHLLPSHIYRSEDRPFATMMDGALAASGGTFNVAVVDANRGRVELRRNDRYWGEKPASTDKLILDVVPDLVTSTQMMRTGQLQMLMTRPVAITDMALGAVPDVSHRDVERQVDLNLALNSKSTSMSSIEQRKRVLSAINPDLIAKVVTGLPDAEPPSEPSIRGDATKSGNGPSAAGELGDNATESSEAKATETNAEGQGTDGASRILGGPGKEGQLIVAAPTDDTPSLAAARMIVDQLNAAGIAAKTVTKGSAELFSEAVPAGEVDAVVSWQKTPRSVSDYLNQFHCAVNGTQTDGAAAANSTDTAEATTSGAEDTPEAATETTTEVEETSAEETGADSSGTEATESEKSERESTGADKAKESMNTSGNITGLCDSELSSLMAELASGSTPLDGARDEINSRVAQANVLVPIVRDRQTVAIGPTVEGPGGPLEEWGTDPLSGIMATAPQWKKKEGAHTVPMEENQ